MFDTGLSLTSLCECLTHIEPVRLLGMELLQQHPVHPQGQWFPSGIPRQQLTDAVTEMLGYSRRCADAAQHIRQLTAVPLTTLCLMEYGL